MTIRKRLSGKRLSGKKPSSNYPRNDCKPTATHTATLGDFCTAQRDHILLTYHRHITQWQTGHS